MALTVDVRTVPPQSSLFVQLGSFVLPNRQVDDVATLHVVSTKAFEVLLVFNLVGILQCEITSRYSLKGINNYKTLLPGILVFLF